MKKKVLAGILAATMAFPWQHAEAQDPVLIPVPPQLRKHSKDRGKRRAVHCNYGTAGQPAAG